MLLKKITRKNYFPLFNSQYFLSQHILIVFLKKGPTSIGPNFLPHINCIRIQWTFFFLKFNALDAMSNDTIYDHLFFHN